MRLLPLLIAVVGLWSASQGAHAAGRQLTATATGYALTYDNSKDYMLLGCFPDGLGERSLDVVEGSTPGKVSADHCAALARSKGLGVFSIQSSDWCHGAPKAALPIALTRHRGSTAYPCEARCSDPAAADVSCGGFFANTVYVFKGKEGYADLGCYTYKTGQAGATDLTGSSAGKMTPAECNRLAASYDFFGLFDGNRCIGFKDLKQAAIAAATGNDACSLACSGGGGAKCGGKASMQLFARNKPLPQLAPVSVSPSDYLYLGCVADQHYYPENKEEPGLESQLLHGNNPVDTTYCASAAKRAGKRFFGTKIGTFCMGGGSLIRALKASARKGVCDQPCAASDPPERKCGGGWGNQAMSLYVLKTGKDWTNLGCYALRADRPPLPELVLDSPKMTVGFCYKRAAAYKFFAVFNGTRCYAGNGLAPSLRNGRGSTGCTTPCGTGSSSSSKQTCGGAAAFMVYVNHAWVAPPPAPIPAPATSAPKPSTTPGPKPSTTPGPKPGQPFRATVLYADGWFSDPASQGVAAAPDAAPATPASDGR